MTDIETDTIHTGDAFGVLADLPTDSVHMCMTSPPYWNLRDYDHDDQLGLEPDPEDYIMNLCDILDAMRRVLRDDGSLWLNLGDTYDNKDLQQIPARVALELQSRGWTLRNRVTWAKPNPMPNSVKDRLNTTTEAIFHLTPSKRYWYDLDAIREEHSSRSQERMSEGPVNADTDGRGTNDDLNPEQLCHPAGKNPGDVFEVTTKPFPDAHFAVYPPELCEKPIKATGPPKVCVGCGAPFERETIERHPWERNIESVERDQLRRALEIADKHDLTEKHFKAIQSVGFQDAGQATEVYDGADRNSHETAVLASKAKRTLGGYFREFITNDDVTDGWQQTCDCDTDGTDPGIVLDPFAGAGTTLLKAKELGRRFVGIELNPEYADMARERVGLDLHDPSNARADGQSGLEGFVND